MTVWYNWTFARKEGCGHQPCWPISSPYPKALCIHDLQYCVILYSYTCTSVLHKHISYHYRIEVISWHFKRIPFYRMCLWRTYFQDSGVIFAKKNFKNFSAMLTSDAAKRRRGGFLHIAELVLLYCTIDLAHHQLPFLCRFCQTDKVQHI